MVDSLKEIVSNYSDSEIYAVLKECNMDPNEAVNRLLSQDPFHEVKSKREKRKENKGSTEFRVHGGSSLSRGGRGGTDRFVGRGGSDSTMHGNYTSSKKENGPSTTMATGYSGSNNNWQPPTTSYFIGNENKKSLAVATDHISSAPHPSAGHQTAWGVGTPGQVSMADIVKMGRPHNKDANTNHNYGHGPSYHETHQFSNYHDSKDSEIHLDSEVCSTQHDSNNDEWPLIEQPSASIFPPNPEPALEHQPYPDSFNLAYDRTDQHVQEEGEVQEIEDHGLNIGLRRVPSGPNPNKMLEDDSGVQSLYDNGIDTYGHNDHSRSFADHDGVRHVPSRPNPNKILECNSGVQSLYDNDIDTYGHKDHNRSFAEHEFDVNTSVSLAAEHMQHLTIHKDQTQPPEDEEGPSVVIPDHLQVQSVDCSRLSFGSFGSINATLSGHSASSAKNHVEEVPVDAEQQPMGHLPKRNSEHFGGETNAPDGDLFRMTRNYESPADLQSDALSVDHSEVPRANQYNYPSSESDYKYENAQQLNGDFSQPQTSSQQVPNLAPFNTMGYSSSLPSNLLAANVHAPRESDISYSIFPTHAMPPKYGNTVSSTGSSSFSIPEALQMVGSSISMPEGLKNVGMSSTQPPSQQDLSLNGTGLATGPALHQHLNLHPYSQHALSAVSPFGNMIGYPFLPQSYAYMPSAFQQAFAGNSAYHQSLAAMHPQYKNSVSVSSLSPQSAAGVPSGYGFGNTAAVSANFQMNNPTAPSVSSLSYDDSPIPHYKDTTNLLSLQQSDNSAASWLQGPNSRTMSAIPAASNYYNFQGQSQQQSGGGGFRQAQQQLQQQQQPSSQNYGSLGHSNFYHSQTGLSMDHHHHYQQQQQQQQLQNPRDGVQVGQHQQQQTNQSQQIWHNNY
ncbi:unnamed protein product [Cuscuta campestris]|uniref:GBF-interacting protein 1 N-terminal domain-containing protein n=1 Tax=Cuscuta campestris TaxID=132261 RepID=A0A484N7I4_9ASTE|nr:unnamed protein product [Cuscuta campestris]